MRDRCTELGVKFDPWQDGVGRIILSKRADGTYATSVGGVVISIPRQVGKTFLFGAIVFALCLLFPGITVIWTAHRLRTADETFAKMQAFSRRRKIAPYCERPRLGSGEQEIRFRNRSRILFGARERGFGRGFDMVDVLVFDEAQILTENAIDDMVPATNQAPNPLLLFSGTPPKPSDPSEVFTAKRDKALTGSSDDMAYVEFSADEGANPDDRKQWAKANPSYPLRTSANAILRMRENLTHDSFLREALGIWPAKGGSVLPPHKWRECTSEKTADPPQVFAVDVAPEQASASIAGGGFLDDLPLGVVLENHPGTGWLVPKLVEFKEAHPNARFVAATGAPTGSVFTDARLAGIELEPVSPAQHAAACSALLAKVLENRMWHRPDEILDRALAGAVKKDMGDGAWLWSRKNSLVDITSLVAFTIALDAVGVGDPLMAMVLGGSK